MKLLFALLLFVAPPDTLELTRCYREAEAHYPRRHELALQDAIAALRVQNLNARFLPALSMNGQASYQSDVARIPFDLPGASPPEVSQDQYKLGLNVDQLVYDGGLTGQQRVLETLQRDLSRQEIEVEVYGLRDRVNAAFFGVLLSQARQASLTTLSEDLRARLALVEARVRQGAALSSTADVLTVELLKVAQQQAEAEAGRRAGLAVLGELLGRTLPDDVALALPASSVEGVGFDARQRPEYEVFDLAQARLAGQQRLAARKNRPQVAGFAEVAYGRPQGLDFFDDAFGPFYALGVRMRWPLWDWQTSRREREALALLQEAVQAQEAAFTQRLREALQQRRSDVERLRELLAFDEEIIARRRRIAARAASQLDNGVITATDYLLERNAEHQAGLTQALHRIQLAQAQVQYLTILGEQP